MEELFLSKRWPMENLNFSFADLSTRYPNHHTNRLGLKLLTQKKLYIR